MYFLSVTGNKNKGMHFHSPSLPSLFRQILFLSLSSWLYRTNKVEPIYTAKDRVFSKKWGNKYIQKNDRLETRA